MQSAPQVNGGRLISAYRSAHHPSLIGASEMIVRKKPTLIAATVAVLVGAAAQAASPQEVDLYFVGSSLLTAAPRTFAPQIDVRQRLDLSGYRKLYIEEMQFSYAAGSAELAIDARHRSQLAGSARESLLRAVGERFEIVTAPGPGVLHLRTTIADIRMEHKPRNLLSFTPIGLVKHGVEAATGNDTLLRSASVRADLFDPNGERLLSVTDASAAAAAADGAGKISWNEVSRTLDRLARQLAGRPELAMAQR
jgi:hypothetical protein